MSWTTQKTMTTADAGSASDWNTYIRDDVTYLHSGRPHFSIYRDNGANYTSNSTVFVNIDSTYLSATLTITGSIVMLGFTGVLYGAGGGITAFDFAVDGTRFGAAGTDGLTIQNTNASNASSNVALTALSPALSVGSHVFSIQWRTLSASTMALCAGSGVAGQDFIPHFWGIEVA